jgi:hypothetical protein
LVLNLVPGDNVDSGEAKMADGDGGGGKNKEASTIEGRCHRNWKGKNLEDLQGEGTPSSTLPGRWRKDLGGEVVGF